MKTWLIAGFSAIILIMTPALAVTQGELLPDPAQEKRARALSSELRCLVCQNQSIDESDAELARDLRRLVRERIVAGDDDPAIRTFLVGRYGEFVLLRPRFSVLTAILWMTPIMALAIGGILAFSLFRRKQDVEINSENSLDAQEKAQIAALLDENNFHSTANITKK